MNIYLDLDNTLVNTSLLDSFSKWDQENKKFDFGRYSFITKLRPYAKSFLAELLKMGSVTILTHAGTAFQKQVLQIHDIKLPLIGIDKYDSVKPSGDSILIDNLPFSHPNIKDKLKAIGSQNHFQITPWYGDTHDNVLMKDLPKIKTAIDKIAS